MWTTSSIMTILVTRHRVSWFGHYFAWEQTFYLNPLCLGVLAFISGLRSVYYVQLQKMSTKAVGLPRH